MDRLLAEDEISNMHTEGSLWADEPYDPARSIAEGDFMPIASVGKSVGKVIPPTLLEKIDDMLWRGGYSPEGLYRPGAENLFEVGGGADKILLEDAAQGIFPPDVQKEFWKKTFPELPKKAQDSFNKFVRYISKEGGMATDTPVRPHLKAIKKRWLEKDLVKYSNKNMPDDLRKILKKYPKGKRHPDYKKNALAERNYEKYIEWLDGGLTADHNYVTTMSLLNRLRRHKNQPTIMSKKLKGFQSGGEVRQSPYDFLETSHTNINNEIDRSDTILGWITGGKWKTSKDIPQLSETGKVTPENLSWLYERITREPDVEYRGGPGGALEAIGSIGKAGALISPTKAPLWKMLGRKKEIPSGFKGATEMSGESILTSMKSGIKEWSPFKQSPEKSFTETMDRLSKSIKDTKKIANRGKRVLERTKLKELQRIGKKFESMEDIKIKPKDIDVIQESRLVLDDVLAQSMDEYKKFGTVSPSKVKYINMLNKSMEKKAADYFAKTGVTPKDIENKIYSYFNYPDNPWKGMSKKEALPGMIKEMEFMMPAQEKILGPYYEAYQVLSALLGKTRHRGTIGYNIKLDPDDLYKSNIIPGKLPQ
jgi:hypothetical protein